MSEPSTTWAHEDELWTSVLLNVGVLGVFSVIFLVVRHHRKDGRLLDACLPDDPFIGLITCGCHKRWSSFSRGLRSPLCESIDAIRDSTYANNYLTYMLTCMWIFGASTVATVCLTYCLAGKGFTFGMSLALVFRGQPLGLYVKYFHAFDIQIIITCIGLIVFFFSLLLEAFVRDPPQKASADMEKMSRTIWLHGLPVKEANRLIPKPFYMDSDKWQGVKATLRDSLEEHLRRRYVLQVRAIEAENLPDRVTNDTREHQGDVSDPFVRLTLGETQLDTHVVLNNLNPKWFSSVPFDFPIAGGEMEDATFRLEVLDANVEDALKTHVLSALRLTHGGSASLARAGESLGYTSIGVTDLPKGKDTWKKVTLDLQQRIPHPGAKISFESRVSGRFGQDLFHKDLDSHAVEELQLTPSVEDIIRARDDVTCAQELMEAWKERKQICNAKLESIHGFRHLLQRCLWLRRKRKAVKMETASRASYARRKKIHAEVSRRKWRMSGSAFVTFKHRKYAEELLSEKGNMYFAMLYRTHTYWSFGQIPFSSVTLKCNSAPHPNDLIWENIHVSEWTSFVRFWFFTVLLFIGMSFLVSSTLVMASVDSIKDLAAYERYIANSTAYMSDANISSLRYFEGQAIHAVASLASTIPQTTLENIADQLPSILLLLINGLVLPTLIAMIAEQERSTRRSTMEQRQVFVNFVFLCLNSIILPFFGEKYLNEVLVRFTEQVLANPASRIGRAVPELQQRLRRADGLFTLRFLLNAAFVSAGWNLAQPAQRIYRLIAVRLAFTKRERKEAWEAWPFAWGYWYAWTLSNFTLGIFAAILTPSALPLNAFSFYLRYKVDKYNLDYKVYAVGEVWDETILVRVVFYMRLVVCFWWIIAGTLFFSVDPTDNFLFESSGSLRSSIAVVRCMAIAHVVLGAVMLIGTWIEKLEAFFAWERQTFKPPSMLMTVMMRFAECVGLRFDDRGRLLSEDEELLDAEGDPANDKSQSSLSWNPVDLKDGDAYRYCASQVAPTGSRALLPRISRTSHGLMRSNSVF